MNLWVIYGIKSGCHYYHEENTCTKYSEFTKLKFFTLTCLIVYSNSNKQLHITRNNRYCFITSLFYRGNSNIVYIDGVAPPTSPSSTTTLSSPISPSSALNENDEYANDGSKSNGSSYTDWMSWKNPKTLDKNRQTSCAPTPTSTTSSMVGFGGKLNTSHHLKLLQTIREQDEGESR